MENAQSSTIRTMIAFGRFRLFAKERLLFYEEERISIGGRAFDILDLLVSNAGQLVLHKEFNEKVWPNTFVEDVNLRVHIASLRKLLVRDVENAHAIRSVPGRGYSFGVHVGYDGQPSGPLAGARCTFADDSGALIGRHFDVEKISQILDERRMVALVGAGGVGKTALARAVLRKCESSQPRPVVRVDVSSLAEGVSVANALKNALDLSEQCESDLASSIALLRHVPHLIFFDGCDLRLPEVRFIVERLIEDLSRVSILVTSREPLRTLEERVYRVAPLDVPSEEAATSLKTLKENASVRLFYERAIALHANEAELGRDSCPHVAEICRKLDGLPLAIALAASQINVLGIVGIVDALAENHSFLDLEHRTTAPRHRTLRTLIDASYDQLSKDEASMLRTVSLLEGNFTVSQAANLAHGRLMSLSDVANQIARLVDKSLLHVIPKSQPRQFRILNTVRAYALDRMNQRQVDTSGSATWIGQDTVGISYCLDLSLCQTGEFSEY